MKRTQEHIKQQVESKGWLHLSDQSEENMETILSSLGLTIFTTDVVVKPDAKGMVTSPRGLDFHTDHHKAKYILWYCYKQTDKGGDTIVVDAEKIFLQLSLDDQKDLCKIKLFEHKIFPDDKESYPLVAEENGKRKFYYSFWLVREEDKLNPALLHFQKLMKNGEFVRLNLKPGDILIVDNHRTFHGRTPIEGSKDRFLKRFWIQ